MNNKFAYTTAAMASCLIHVCAVGFIGRTYTIPQVRNMEEKNKITLEIVENKPREEKERPVRETKYRDAADAISRAPEVIKEGGEGPKVQSQVDINKVSAATPHIEPHPSAEPHAAQAEAEKIQVEELKEKMELLKELEKELELEKRELERRVESAEAVPAKRLTTQVIKTKRMPMSPREERLFNNMRSEVDDKGDMSIAAREDELAEYLNEMRYKVFKAWFPLISIKAGAMPDSHVVISFIIRPDGAVDEIRVLNAQGSAAFSELCKAAIAQAGPFGPIPVEIPVYVKNRFLRIRFSFDYD